MPTERRVERMREVLARKQFDLQVVIENVHDAHNASAILRTADGFGVATVNLLYTNEEWPEISKPVSAFTKKWMAQRRFAGVAEAFEALRAEGMRVYATHLGAGAVDYREVDWTQPSAFVVGNEHRGCSEEAIALADGGVHIPMVGFAQSYNVSVSAAIILAEAYRQRDAAGLLAPRWDERRERILEEWIAREQREGEPE
jgi:tRNA (guanosine-2'-O-)-methyltransferase